MGSSVTRKTVSLACIGLIVGLGGQNAWGHGGVYVEEDLCVIRIGYLKAHFTIFQPQTRRYTEYCEDLPDVTESVFVLEYAHDGLSAVAMDFRIIQDVTGLGRFARWGDIAKIEDIDQATVFHKPASAEPDIFMVVHQFDAPGNYVGIVTATEPTSGEVIRAVFPFEVGFAVGLGYWPLLLLVVVLIQVNYWWLRRRRESVARMACLTVVGWLVFAASSNTAQAEDFAQSQSQVVGSLRIGFASRLVPIPTNKIHRWVARVTTLEGKPVETAQITVDGGMPQHDHGLPTRPEVTRYLGDGEYLVEGMKFHMAGSWTVRFHITVAGVTEVATFQITL